jgi:hypothetical protein
MSNFGDHTKGVRQSSFAARFRRKTLAGRRSRDEGALPLVHLHLSSQGCPFFEPQLSDPPSRRVSRFGIPAAKSRIRGQKRKIFFPI